MLSVESVHISFSFSVEAAGLIVEHTRQCMYTHSIRDAKPFCKLDIKNFTLSSNESP